MSESMPNYGWYSSRSQSLKLSPRCPIARSELCPRYYSSYWLLGNAGITTKISEDDKSRLDKKWSVFKPVVSEEEPSISRCAGEFCSFSNFCPEVAYEIFGYFAAGLSRYADDLDAGIAHKELKISGASGDDPRWKWASVTARHYTECREFSHFNNVTTPTSTKRQAQRRVGMGAKLRWQVFSRDSFCCMYCGRRPPDVALEVDHRVSVVNGGSDELENLITSCVDCNRGKGAENSL